MTMRYRILVGQELDSNQNQKISNMIYQTFKDTDQIFNKWNPQSEISLLNKQEAEVSITLSPLLNRLFLEADHIVALSKNRFDPTIEPLQQLWKDKLKLGMIPTENEITKIKTLIGWNTISFENGIFRKKHQGTKIDFGAIAKGLCIDLIIERLNDYGINNLFVEWGGEIRTIGTHPQGRFWTIYITRLGDNDPDHAIDTVFLNNQAIATSGDYLQNWTMKTPSKENKDEITTYFHIFDPIELCPLKATYRSIASTSVIASNCALADGIATTLMLFPSKEEAIAWAESVKNEVPDMAFWITSRSD